MKRTRRIPSVALAAMFPLFTLSLGTLSACDSDAEDAIEDIGDGLEDAADDISDIGK